MDLQIELNNKLHELDIAVNSLKQIGEQYAKAYTDYRIALAQELLILKNEGYAITLAQDIARGKPQIAHLKFQEISKEALYKANIESINAIKLSIKILQEQITREYGINE